ncbi:Succinate dehydrogenase cytochrome b560 subunit, mitochondrial [Aphelenchoides besseyi]|nr:Succinate dehydrogenase cytochrome b560 subunit, mitochondrial [Aphelenchoides besseyi]
MASRLAFHKKAREALNEMPTDFLYKTTERFTSHTHRPRSSSFFVFFPQVHLRRHQTVMLFIRLLGQRYPILVKRLHLSAVRSSETKTPVQKWGYDYLMKQQKLKRPLSPHLNIYQPQITWCLSGAHRISGCLMGGTLLVGGLGFALLPITYEQLINYIRSWNLPSVVTGAFKFFISFNIVFYALNGLRLLGFDLAKGTDLVSIYRGGYLVLALAAVISLFVVWNSSAKNKRS